MTHDHASSRALMVVIGVALIVAHAVARRRRGWPSGSCSGVLFVAAGAARLCLELKR